ncbi:MAG: FAD-dependent oxidoreductase [Oscillatoria sp. PMC 1051.18]|nr:FAD-dependent oxidoreductase [Oscillatoria sp. PMC 1050.18]MEC5032468.1 FAD-dependent oxidoreductase [Oscillatoria sp. PMC 1051.18]
MTASELTGIDANQVIDVAVVGGGVSGTYLGWRLATSKKYTKVHLYELSDRLGGRLLSVPMPEMPHVIAEFGGMGFLSCQEIVSQLVTHLNIPTKPFPVGSPNNLYYLRGKHLYQREEDLTNQTKVPYNLRQDEQGIHPAELTAKAFLQLIPELKNIQLGDRASLEKWQHLRETWQVDGQYLYNMALWELLLKTLSHEAYKFSADTNGYFFYYGTWNAAQAIEVQMVNPGLENRNAWNDAKTLQQGYQQLPETLAAEFQKHNGQIHRQHRLISFAPYGNSQNPLLKLTFEDRTQKHQVTVFAKHLILAMPKRSLELLDQNNFFFRNPQLRRNLQAVSTNPAFKLFLCYPYPWWRKLQIEDGTSITDLPIRNCFYFGTEGEQTWGKTPPEPQNINSLMMASFTDGHATNFWQVMKEDVNSSDRELLTASEKMVFTAQQQLKELHNLEDLPSPYAAFYLDWTKDPYGGGWHTWTPLCKPWEIIPQIRRPIPEQNIYICGDCYSNVQGWVQGALNSAEKVLQDHFNLTWPDWLDKDYDLGP